jgi:hypothetical protein
MPTPRPPATTHFRRRSEPFAGYRSPGWIVLLFGSAAVVLLPWILLRIRALPAEHRAAHWNVAWTGLDIALAALLLAVAVAALRRSLWLEGAATAAATLLLTDAWFDVLTTSSRGELLEAILEAALVEVPLAVVCLLLARRAKRGLLLPAPVTLHAVPEAPASTPAIPYEDRLSA